MNLSGVEPMAKKEAAKKTSKGAMPSRKPMVVQIRGGDEYKAWVEGLADKEGFSVAMLFERAVRKWAKEIGYPDPPKR